jgi:hypothetical protein
MPVHDWTRVGAGVFHDFHLEWISAIKRALNAGLLPRGFYAMVEQVAAGFQPDVVALERDRPAAAPSGGRRTNPARPAGGGVALAAAPPRVRFTAAAEPERYAARRRRVAVRHGSGDQVVAIVEVVSPGNKDSRNALRSFVEKAVEFLNAGVHLLLLDLFPPGPRDPQGTHAAVWSEIIDDGFRLPADKPLTLVAYAAGLVKRAFIEPVAVGDVLPDMPVFLNPDLYVPTPLEATYRTAFEGVTERWREVLESPPAVPSRRGGRGRRRRS